MACPGSVRLSTGKSGVSSEFAKEGTAAHALAEICLRDGHPASAFVGMGLEGVEVDEDMVDYVQIFVDYCKGLVRDAQPFDIANAGEYWWIERKFNLAQLNPPAPMFGTADFVVYDERTRSLEVVDLKYGQGVVVEVKGNPQLRYYALGAALSMEGLPIEEVKITIVQPRAVHPDGIVRSETLDYLELIGFAGDLLEAARRTQDPNAPLNPGSHCRFCLASGVCPAQRDRALAVAQQEYGNLEEVVPPLPETIPVDELPEYLSKFGILESWMKAVQARAVGMLERGEEVPGYKLVAKRATRKWADDSETEEWLKAKGNTVDEIFEMKLKSPAKIEKLVGKKNLPSDLVTKVSSGYSMVPFTDPRPPVQLERGEEFPLLPAPVEEDE